jgi:hypothetical protein
MGVLFVAIVISLAVSAGVMYGIKWILFGGIGRLQVKLTILFFRIIRRIEFRWHHPDLRLHRQH